LTDKEYLTVPHLNTKQIKRIFSKIHINRKTGCWERFTNLNRQGYGKVGHKGRTELLHRLLYAWAVQPLQRRKRGEIKDNWLELDHVVCSNPRCCNPAHLNLVTTKENCLRGNSPIAINAKKTHCVNGHPLPAEPNRHSKGRSRRRCIPCQLEIESRRPPRPCRESLRLAS
jgi:hypothetical protein